MVVSRFLDKNIMQKINSSNKKIGKKIKTSIKFFRPKTFKLEKNPKYQKKLDKKKKKKKIISI